MTNCEKGVPCNECASRGMCSSYAAYMYVKGREDALGKPAIDKESIQEAWEDVKKTTSEEFKSVKEKLSGVLSKEKVEEVMDEVIVAGVRAKNRAVEAARATKENVKDRVGKAMENHEKREAEKEEADPCEENSDE